MIHISKFFPKFANEIILVHDQDFNHRPRNALPATLRRQSAGL